MKKAKKSLSVLLALIMTLSALPLLAISSSAALPNGLDSYFTVNSSKVSELAKKATTDGLIKKLTDYNWFYAEHGSQNGWPHFFHIKNNKMYHYVFGGGNWDNLEYSYQKKSGATISFNNYYSITDIGLDQVLILTYNSTSYKRVEILFKCDKKFYLSRGWPTVYDSEKVQYRDYENRLFISPRLSQSYIKQIRIKNNGNVEFFPSNPSYKIFYPNMITYNKGKPYSEQAGYIQYTINITYNCNADRGYTKNCCVLFLNDFKNGLLDDIIYLVKQGNDYIAFVYNNYNHMIIEDWQIWFSDVPYNAWFYDAVDYVNNYGYMVGYSRDRFGAVDTLKRQDFIVTLANVADADLSEYANTDSKLKDIKKGAYYAAAVNWAVDNGIIAGYANGNFGVNDPITREQVATILYRYMGEPSVSNVNSTLAKFSDSGRISSFAKTPVAWAVQNNIISGMADGRVAPTEGASRAQIASIIMRMDQNGMF